MIKGCSGCFGCGCAVLALIGAVLLCTAVITVVLVAL